MVLVEFAVRVEPQAEGAVVGSEEALETADRVADEARRAAEEKALGKGKTQLEAEAVSEAAAAAARSAFVEALDEDGDGTIDEGEYPPPTSLPFVIAEAAGDAVAEILTSAPEADVSRVEAAADAAYRAALEAGHSPEAASISANAAATAIEQGASAVAATLAGAAAADAADKALDAGYSPLAAAAAGKWAGLASSSGDAHSEGEIAADVAAQAAQQALEAEMAPVAAAAAADAAADAFNAGRGVNGAMVTGEVVAQAAQAAIDAGMGAAAVANAGKAAADYLSARAAAEYGIDEIVDFALALANATQAPNPEATRLASAAAANALEDGMAPADATAIAQAVAEAATRAANGDECTDPVEVKAAAAALLEGVENVEVIEMGCNDFQVTASFDRDDTSPAEATTAVTTPEFSDGLAQRLGQPVGVTGVETSFVAIQAPLPPLTPPELPPPMPPRPSPRPPPPYQPLAEAVATDIAAIEGYNATCSGEATTRAVVQRFGKGLGAVIAKYAQALDGSERETLDAGREIREAIMCVEKGFRLSGASRAGDVHTSSLNVSFRPLLALRSSPELVQTLTFATNGASTSIQLPRAVLPQITAVSSWTSGANVHGGGLSVPGRTTAQAEFAGPRVSYTIVATATALSALPGRLLFAVPLDLRHTGASGCVGLPPEYPKGYDVLAAVQAYKSPCKVALECRSWEESSGGGRWSRNGCEAVRLLDGDGAIGCECDTAAFKSSPVPSEGSLTLDIVAVATPSPIDPLTVDFIALAPERQAASRCQCSDTVDAVCMKRRNRGGVEQRLLSIVADRSGSGYRWKARTIEGDSLARPVSPSGQTATIPVVINAAGLPETPLGFTEEATVDVEVSNATEGRSFRVGIDATVLAETVASRTVWGIIPAGSSSCADADLDGSFGFGSDLAVSAYLGEERRVPFTACDFDGLRVDHTLPAPLSDPPDTRQFAASLRGLSAPVASVEPRGGGEYVAVFKPGAVGNLDLRLQLGNADATPSNGATRIEVLCPPGLVDKLDSGSSLISCQCDQGFEGYSSQGCTPCEPGYKKDMVEESCTECPAGYAQPNSGQPECVQCSAGTYQPDKGQQQCMLCSGPTTSAAPFHGCTQCELGNYRLVEPANSSNCRPCPPKGEGGWDCDARLTTLQTINLTRGMWRYDPNSLLIEECRSDGHRTPCLGGTGEADATYCTPGHSGYRCEVCDADDDFFDTSAAKCTACRPGVQVALYICVLLLPLLAVLLAAYIEKRGLRRSTRLSRFFARLRVIATEACLPARLRVLVGFAQVSAAVGPYSIELPSSLKSLVLFFQYLGLDVWGELYVGGYPCIGGYLSYLLLTAILPPAILAAVWASSHLVRRCSKGATCAFGPLDMLPACLAVVLLLSPTVASAAYGAFHCRRVVTTSTDHYILWAEPEVACGSGAHTRLRVAASLILFFWAACPLLGLGLLLVRLRTTVPRPLPPIAHPPSAAPA